MCVPCGLTKCVDHHTTTHPLKTFRTLRVRGVITLRQLPVWWIDASWSTTPYLCGLPWKLDSAFWTCSLLLNVSTVDRAHNQLFSFMHPRVYAHSSGASDIAGWRGEGSPPCYIGASSYSGIREYSSILSRAESMATDLEPLISEPPLLRYLLYRSPLL